MNERYSYNRFILNKLGELIEKYPELRFGQLLVNAGIVELKPKKDDAGNYSFIVKDPFYEEPDITWKRVQSNRFAFPPDL